MIKFTKEEIDLCKQVAEKYRKLIEEGDWYLPYIDDIEPELYIAGITDKKANVVGIPLWTISDCLEFFESKGWDVLGITWQEVATRILVIHHASDFGKGDYAVVMQNKSKRMGRIIKGNTRLSACLKAILAVLEEAK